MPHVELPQAEFKVVVLGDTDAGKTSLVLRFAEGYYRDRRSSTVGAFFITKRIQTSNGITCKIQIWDTAGQAQFRPMAPMYYRNAAAAVVCYDVTSRQSYQVMTEWLDELHRNVPAGSIVIAIAATKCDKLPPDPTTTNNNDTTDTDTLTTTTPLHDPSDSTTQLPAVPFEEAEALAQTLGAIFVRTSAKGNEGVSSLFQRVAERVLRFRKQSDAGMQASIPVTPGAVASSAGSKVGSSSGSRFHGLNDTATRNSGGGGGGGGAAAAEYGSNGPNGVNAFTASARLLPPNGGTASGPSRGHDTYHFDAIPDGDTAPHSETKNRQVDDFVTNRNVAPIPGEEFATQPPSTQASAGGKNTSKDLAMCSGPFMCDVFSTSTLDVAGTGPNDPNHGTTVCSIS